MTLTRKRKRLETKLMQKTTMMRKRKERQWTQLSRSKRRS